MYKKSTINLFILQYRLFIGAVALFLLVSLSPSATSESEKMITSLQRATLTGTLLSGSISQLLAGATYRINIGLGEPSFDKKTMFSKGEPRLLGTWKIYTGYGKNAPTAQIAGGVVECKVGPRSELIINLQQGVSNGKTVLTLSKANFQRKDFVGLGLLFVRQSMQTTYYTEASNLLKTLNPRTEDSQRLTIFLKGLSVPDGVGIIKFIDEDFSKSLNGLDLIKLSG